MLKEQSTLAKRKKDTSDAGQSLLDENEVVVDRVSVSGCKRASAERPREPVSVDAINFADLPNVPFVLDFQKGVVRTELDCSDLRADVQCHVNSRRPLTLQYPHGKDKMARICLFAFLCLLRLILTFVTGIAIQRPAVPGPMPTSGASFHQSANVPRNRSHLHDAGRQSPRTGECPTMI